MKPTYNTAYVSFNSFAQSQVASSMTTTPSKRSATGSPEGARASKRPTPSTPEEGELSPHPSLSLPSKPTVAKTKIPFPFKKKGDPPLGAAVSVLPEPSDPAVIALFDRPADDERRTRDKEREADPRRWPNRGGDHWEPSYARGSDRSDRFHHSQSRWQPRERPRSPVSGHVSPRLHPSGSPPPSHRHHDKYRPPVTRSPDPVFSPPQRRDLDRFVDRQRNDSWRPRNDDDDRRTRGGRIDGNVRHHRPRDDRPRDNREWTRRDEDWQRREEDRGDRWRDYSRDAERHRYMDSYRPISPGPLALSRSSSPTPRLPIVAQPPSLDEAVPPSPSTLPPSNITPNNKNQTLLSVDAAVPIVMKRPFQKERSPTQNPLTLVHQAGLPPPPLPPSLPPQEQQTTDSEFKPPEVPKFRSIRKGKLHRRTVKEEMEAYGREFIGCGVQSDYDLTTKLGEGTFGFVLFHTQLKKFH